MRCAIRWTFLLALSLALAGCPGHDDDHDHDHDHHHDHSHHHDHTGANAHFWLDPVRTRNFAETLAGPLGEVTDAAAARQGKAVIAVSIHPLAALVESLAGEAATVRVLLPPGGSPHGFEITPDILRTLADADAVLIVGLSLDPWAAKAVKSNPKLQSKPLWVFADLLDKHEHGQASPPPAGSPAANRLKTTLAKLDAIDEQYRRGLASVKKKEMVTFHNAFDLLAERYGLKVVAHLTEMDLPTGAEVTPRHLQEAAEAVDRYQLKVLYAEPQYPDTAMQSIARRTGVAILRLDDMGAPDREGSRDYFQMMATNLKTLMDGQNR